VSDINDVLTTWLPQQRWYGGKDRGVRSVHVLHEERLPTGSGAPADVRHTLVQVTDDSGAVELYQLLLGYLDGEPEPRLEGAVAGTVEGRHVYDALHDLETPGILLRLLAERRSLSRLRFSSTADLELDLAPRVMGAEQSNTSVVFGESYILKLFRRVQPGLNPDLEVTRALAEADCPYVAAPLGWLETDLDDGAGRSTTLAMLQVFERWATEGWAMATASVRDLFAEADLHADEVGGDFAAESERLGTATAEVHALLARVLPARTAGPEESEQTAHQLIERFESAAEVVPELAAYADGVRALYEQVGHRTDPVPVQRIHGDYHLGQVLRTQAGWVLLDFEGEPARPLAERTALMSPLRDVAGMLRSYDYAARHLLAERSEVGAGAPQLVYRAAEWAERNREAFCDGYAKAAGVDPRDEVVLLRAFELDKAVYEVVYEARNRPSWLSIPLGSIERLLSDPKGAQ
jgi:maltokinase